MDEFDPDLFLTFTNFFPKYLYQCPLIKDRKWERVEIMLPNGRQDEKGWKWNQCSLMIDKWDGGWIQCSLVVDKERENVGVKVAN